MPFLITILTWFTRYLVIKSLAILGLGIASYAIIQYLFDRYVNAGLSALGGMPADITNLIAVAHLDHAISIVLGAMSVRAFIYAVRTVVGGKS